MKISKIMSTDVCVIAPGDTLQRAAELMERNDIGSLPVGDNGKLVGMLTDRDIALRGVARRLGADAPVSQVMTDKIRYCYDDEDIDDVARNMSDLQMRRLPVVNRNKDLVGIVSLADFAHSGDASASAELVQGVAVPHHESHVQH